MSLNGLQCVFFVIFRIFTFISQALKQLDMYNIIKTQGKHYKTIHHVWMKTWSANVHQSFFCTFNHSYNKYFNANWFNSLHKTIAHEFNNNFSLIHFFFTKTLEWVDTQPHFFIKPYQRTSKTSKHLFLHKALATYIENIQTIPWLFPAHRYSFQLTLNSTTHSVSTLDLTYLHLVFTCHYW